MLEQQHASDFLGWSLLRTEVPGRPEHCPALQDWLILDGGACMLPVPIEATGQHLQYCIDGWSNQADTHAFRSFRMDAL